MTLPVKAKISTIGGFSAHADQHALMTWLNGFENAPIRTFITHGDTLIAEVGQEASINGKTPL